MFVAVMGGYLTARAIASSSSLGSVFLMSPGVALPQPECYRLSSLPQQRCYRRGNSKVAGDGAGQFAGYTFPGYTALYTVVLNLAITIVLTPIFNALSVPAKPFDETAPADYHA